MKRRPLFHARCGRSRREAGPFSAGFAPSLLSPAPALTDEVRALLEDAAIPKQTTIGSHSALAGAQGVALRGAVDDIMLLSYALNPTTHQALADVAARHGQPSPSSLAAGAAAIHGLVAALKAEVEKAGVERVYREIDLPWRRFFLAWSKPGCASIPACWPGLHSGSRRRSSAWANGSSSWPASASTSTRPSSLAWCSLLIWVCGAASRGKGNAVSTAQDVLEQLAEKHDVPRLVLEYRHLAKLKSTYIDALPLLADANSRVHTTFQAAATATGRLSSVNPNLQNIPTRTNWAARFVPPSPPRRARTCCRRITRRSNCACWLTSAAIRCWCAPTRTTRIFTR